MMTIDEVAARIEKIKERVGDNESAHAEEDELYETVLRSIADGAENAQALAAAAIKAYDIDYQRWYA